MEENLRGGGIKGKKGKYRGKEGKRLTTEGISLANGQQGGKMAVEKKDGRRKRKERKKHKGKIYFPGRSERVWG